MIQDKFMLHMQHELVHTFDWPKSFSAFTASSILINGGQGLLKPSPGSFFAASMPSLRPGVG
jgi:hypothetical protein